MRCQVTSNKTHDIVISKEISYKSFKEICSEKKKVNLGHWGNWDAFMVENNTLLREPLREKYPNQYLNGEFSAMPFNWEVLYKFFSMYNLEPTWLDCNYSTGHYDDELGGWTGCVGKV